MAPANGAIFLCGDSNGFLEGQKRDFHEDTISGYVTVTKPRPVVRQRRVGALSSRVQFSNSVDMAPDQRELIVLSLLAGLGFGLALAHGDLLFLTKRLLIVTTAFVDHPLG
jgi:hypothetical protein